MMVHALIIGDDRASVDILEEKLWDAGYHSIMAVEDVAAAEAVARSLVPSLIVFVPDLPAARPTDALRRLSDITGSPIIVATADPAGALRCLGPAAALEGPYATSALAHAAARGAQPRFATAA